MFCFRRYSAEVSQVTVAFVPGAPSLLWGLIYSLSQQEMTILPHHQVSQSLTPHHHLASLILMEMY